MTTVTLTRMRRDDFLPDSRKPVANQVGYLKAVAYLGKMPPGADVRYAAPPPAPRKNVAPYFFAPLPILGGGGTGSSSHLVLVP